jgi:transposase InsO family protein
MSRKGNCWDNAPMESCFGTLKTELVLHLLPNPGCRPARLVRQVNVPRELFGGRVAIEDIDHTRTKTKSLQCQIASNHDPHFASNLNPSEGLCHIAK